MMTTNGNPDNISDVVDYDALIEETEASRNRILAWVDKQKSES